MFQDTLSKRGYVLVVVSMLLLSGCSGLGPISDEPNNETTDTNISEESDTVADSNDDGISDTESEDLGLDPDRDYPELFIRGLELQNNKKATEHYLSVFTKNSKVPDQYRPVLRIYINITTSNSNHISKINNDLIVNHSYSHTQDKLEIIDELSENQTSKLVRSYNISSTDWDYDNVSNTNEFEYETNPLNHDSDSDGLNDGEEIYEYNTDLLNPDTDDDGLLDGLEVNHQKYPNADPLQKDIFVEVDYGTGSKPSDQDLREVEEVFDESPVENSGGEQGINVHFILDEELSDRSTSDSIDANQYYDNRGYGYYHAIFVDEVYSNGEEVSGIATFISNSPTGNFFVATDPTQGSTDIPHTLLHEFGHALGLNPSDDRINGADSKNIKSSNYMSVMNYNYDSPSIRYSDGTDSPRGTDDWSHIQCRLAVNTAEKLQGYGHGEVVLRESWDERYDIHNERYDRECAFGFRFSSPDTVILIEQNNSETYWENISEFKEDSRIKEYEKFNSTGEKKVEISIENNGKLEDSQEVKLQEGFVESQRRTIDSKEIRLESGEQTTVEFTLDIPELGSSFMVYQIKTRDDYMEIHVETIDSSE
jgi:hypothetical protein